MRADHRSQVVSHVSAPRVEHLWPSSGQAVGEPLDDSTTWDVLERLQTTYRELVPLLLGHIQLSDALTAHERADRLDELVDELRTVAVALRTAVAPPARLTGASTLVPAAGSAACSRAPAWREERRSGGTHGVPTAVNQRSSARAARRAKMVRSSVRWPTAHWQSEAIG